MAGRPHCDTACAEEGTQNAAPSSDSIPASPRPPAFLTIGTRVPACALAFGSRRLRSCRCLGCTRPFHWKGPLACRHSGNPTSGQFHAFTGPPTKPNRRALTTPDLPINMPTEKQLLWVTVPAVQPSADLPSLHSFHGEVSSSGRLPLSIPLVQLCAAHTPKSRRARFRALRLRSASGIDSASLRSFPSPSMKRMFFIGLLRPNFSHWRHIQNVRAPTNVAKQSDRVRFLV
jgi:hypothetical protein